jgi:hypothetical protein
LEKEKIDGEALKRLMADTPGDKAQT